MSFLGKIFSGKSMKVYENTSDHVSVYDDRGDIKGYATTYGQEDTVYYNDAKTNTTTIFDRFDHANGSSTISKNGSEIVGLIHDFDNGHSEYYDKEGNYITTVDNNYGSFNSDSTLISEYYSSEADAQPQKEGFLSFLFGNGSLPSSKSEETHDTTSTSESSYNYFASSYSDSYFDSGYDSGSSYGFDSGLYDDYNSYDDYGTYNMFDDDDDDDYDYFY